MSCNRITMTIPMQLNVECEVVKSQESSKGQCIEQTKVSCYSGDCAYRNWLEQIELKNAKQGERTSPSVATTTRVRRKCGHGKVDDVFGSIIYIQEWKR